MPVVKPYTFVPGTDIIADEVNANFDGLVGALNNDYLPADGSVPFTNVPSGPATDPTSANHLVRKQYVDQRISGGAATFTTEPGGLQAGYATVNHNLGTTPTWVVVTGKAPIGGSNIAAQILADSFTSTTFRVRVINNTGGALSGATVTISYCCGV